MGDRDLSGYETQPSVHPIAAFEGGRRRFQRSVRIATEAVPASPTCTTDAASPSPISILMDCCRFLRRQPGRPVLLLRQQDEAAPAFRSSRIKLVGRPEWPNEIRIRRGQAEERVLDRATRVGGARLRVARKTALGKCARCKAAWASPRSRNTPCISASLTRPRSRRSSVWWPSGRTQEITGDDARRVIGHHIRWTEGGTPVWAEGNKQ